MPASLPAAFDTTRSKAPASLQFAASSPKTLMPFEAEQRHDPLEKKLRLEPPLEERQVELGADDLPYDPGKARAGAYIRHSCARAKPALLRGVQQERASRKRGAPGCSRAGPCRRGASSRSRNRPLAGSSRRAAPLASGATLPNPGRLRARSSAIFPSPCRMSLPGHIRARSAPALLQMDHEDREIGRAHAGEPRRLPERRGPELLELEPRLGAQRLDIVREIRRGSAPSPSAASVRRASSACGYSPRT